MCGIRLARCGVSRRCGVTLFLYTDGDLPDLETEVVFSTSAEASLRPTVNVIPASVHSSLFATAPRAEFRSTEAEAEAPY